VTRNGLTVEELARDTLDVRELNCAGLLTGDWITLRPSLRWPRIATMRLARDRILLELRNQSVPQGIRVSWKASGGSIVDRALQITGFARS
jgi:hypothetical protein